MGKLRGCYSCRVVEKNGPPEELRITPLPVTIDLLSVSEGLSEGPLVVLNYQSRWLEVAYMKVTNAKCVSGCLEIIFTLYIS